jgi:predicted DNA-binding antitoxin AbrB/MazE fold protein
MTRMMEAVYEKGSLRPLEVVNLREGDHVWIQLLPADRAIVSKLAALDDVAKSGDEMTEEQWKIFEEASARRPFFRHSEASSR